MSNPIPTVFIPALLCDEAMYADVIAATGDRIIAHVLMSPKPALTDSVADILSRAPDRFVLVGTSYGGSLALAIAVAAPDRVMGLWIMGADPGAPAAGGPDLPGGLENDPDATIEMLNGLVVLPAHEEAAATFRTMAQRVGGENGAAQARALGSRADLTGDLASLTMPALALWGEADALVPVAVGKALADAMPDARFAAIAECGHLPTLEKPADSARHFATLLDRIG